MLDIETALGKPVGWLSDSKNINPNFLNVVMVQEKFERDFEEIESAFTQNLPVNCVEIPIFNVDTVGQYVGGSNPPPINTTFSGIQAGTGLFGFLMPDDSMFDPNTTIFFDKDDVLIISPEIRNLHSSDCALVQLKQPEQTFIIAQFYNNIRGQYFKQHQEDEILTFDNIEQIVGMVVEKQKPLFDSATLQQKLANQ
nr:hypothetical protein LVJ77_03735 [Conchiformibius kuhniae]